jgi:uncharacterized protein (TIGR02444 family)
MAAAEALALDNPLWRFVLPFYGRDGVSPACLTLQDTLGVDVNLLLLASFAAVEHGLVLDEADLAAADGLVRDWRSEVVEPLRRVRNRMKAGPLPAPSPATEPLRNKIKAAELDGEQIALALLFAWFDRQPARRPGATDASAPEAVARHFHPQGAFAPKVDAALRTLSHAIDDARAATTARRS